MRSSSHSSASAAQSAVRAFGRVNPAREPSSRPAIGPRRTPRAVGLLALAIALFLAACSGSAAAAPTVTGAWMRLPAGPNQPSAAYLAITNSGTQADALLSASSPSAASVEIHDTTTDMNGMTGMAPVPRVDVPAGATVTFGPGGLHLMVMGITGTIAVGQTIELDLMFEHAGRVVVRADVRQG
jgi:copper(I)-binding protein